MRKLAAVVLSTMLVVTGIMPVSAQESRQTTITVSIDPAYTVTIPASAIISSGNTESGIGRVTLENARLEPGRCVQVSAEASGRLKNSKDSTKTIPYKLMSGDDEFSSASYFTSGSNTQLALSISRSDWDNAYAGQYEDTIVFTISYR